MGVVVGSKSSKLKKVTSPLAHDVKLMTLQFRACGCGGGSDAEDDISSVVN